MTGRVLEYEPVRPVSRRRALVIGIWVGWGVDSIVTDLWPRLTDHTVRLGMRDLAIAAAFWAAAYLKPPQELPPLRDVLRGTR